MIIGHEHLPIWFLVLSIFLPRIATFVLWYQDFQFPVMGFWGGVLWLFLARVVVIWTIYNDQGTTPWFWIHLVVAILVWLTAGNKSSSSSSSD